MRRVYRTRPGLQLPEESSLFADVGRVLLFGPAYTVAGCGNFTGSKKGIISRSFAPTISIGWFASCCRICLKFGYPLSASAIQFLANLPAWMSARICFIAFFVSAVTIFGPAV